MGRIHILLTTLIASIAANAQEWTGALSTDWNDPANWSDWPLDGEDINVTSANLTGLQAYPVISAASAFTPDRVFVEGEMLLTITGTLTVDDRMIVGYPAVVSMTAGQFTTDRLIIEGGGFFSFSGGTIDIGTGLAIVDGGLNGPSAFDQSGGTLNVTGALEFECETGDFDPRYLLSNGSLNVTGDVIWFGEAPGSGRPVFSLQGGDATVSGSLLNTPASTVDMDVRITSNAEFAVAGPTIDMPHATDSIFQNNATLMITGDATWTNNGGYRAEYGNVSFHGDSRLQGSGTFDIWSMSITAAGALEHLQPDTITLRGSFSSFGSFDANQNTVAFIGEAGSLAGLSPTAFHNLVFDLAGTNILVTGSYTVAGTLSLLNGRVTTTQDALTLLDNAVVQGGSSSSYVNGPLRKIGDDDFAFPVGKNGEWHRIGISGITDGNASFSAEYFDMPHYNTDSLATGVTGVSDIEYWRLTRSGTSDGARVALHWEDAAASGLDACDGVMVAYYEDYQWQATPSTASGSCSGNDPGSTSTDGLVTLFDTFTIGVASADVAVNHFGERIAPRLSFSMDRNTPELVLEGTTEAGTLSVRDAQGRAITERALRSQQPVSLGALAPGHYTAVWTSASDRIAIRFVRP